MTDVETVRCASHGTSTTKLLDELRDLVAKIVDLESPTVTDVRQTAIAGKVIADKFMQMDQLILAGAGIPDQWEEALLQEDR